MRPVAAAHLLRADGGMALNDWLMQFLADMAGTAVERPQVAECTALGAALLAGVGAGLFASPEEAARAWRCAKRFQPAMQSSERDALMRTWRTLIDHVRQIRTR